MAALTAEKAVSYKNASGLVAFPVASGETIYRGAFNVVNQSGYLADLDSANVANARIVAIPVNGSANASGPAATTSNGSISGSLCEASADAGDKTVRECIVDGIVECVFSSIAQSDVGKVVYASNNNTSDESAVAGFPVGTLVTYISSTSGYVMLNTFFTDSGYRYYKGAIIAATTTTGGDAISWANPSGETILVADVVLDVTTQATGAATMDVGVAADGSTSSDTIFDGIDVGTAAILANATSGDGGTNGKLARKLTSTQYITGTPSATLAGLVGTFGVLYRLHE